MRTSQNGYPVLESSRDCSVWYLPISGQKRHILLRPGHVGFVLACFITWFHRVIEPVNLGTWDEWGWAPRNIRGSDEVSNHASGTAVDINATKHPLGARGTFSAEDTKKIRRKLRRWFYVIGWGGNYQNRADEMHFEINRGLPAVRRLARVLRFTRIGRQVMRANAHYRSRNVG